MNKYEHTELEQHVIDYFSGPLGWEYEWDDKKHCLQEFYDAYKENKDAYTSTPEEIELINKCIKIIDEDIKGADYTAKNCETVIKAIEQFGL